VSAKYLLPLLRGKPVLSEVEGVRMGGNEEIIPPPLVREIRFTISRTESSPTRGEEGFKISNDGVKQNYIIKEREV